MPSLPYFNLYPKDIFVDDRMQLLKSEEQGLFILFLCKIWINDNEIRDDDSKVSRMLRIPEKKWRNLKDQLVELGLLSIDSSTGFITNRRLTAEYEHSLEKCEKAAKAAGKRWSHKKSKEAARTDDFFFDIEPLNL